MARKTGSHADITGPKVRDAALRLFAQDGYAAVSMRRIAAEVGVQAGALYLYTPDKQSLLADLMRDHMEALLAAWDVADPGGDVCARFEAFIRFHIRYHFDRADEIFLAYNELRNLTPENFAEIEGLRRAYEDRLEKILSEGTGAGAFQIADTKVATMAIIAMITGVTTWFREGGRLERAEVEEIYWDMARRAVGA